MKRVFIVEDEAVVAMELKAHLQAMGYEVCGHAVRGDVALVQIPEAGPDLIVMDIKLRGALTGLDVVEALRGVIDVPVILLTAYSDAELTERAARTGLFAYVVKPFEPHVLRANIELALVRHEAAVALRQSEARFRALFDQAAVGVVEIEATTGRCLRANHKAAEILGYGVDELGGLDVLALIHADDRAAGAAALERIRLGDLREHRSELRYLRKDGAMVWVERSASLIQAGVGGAARIMAVMTDVTARKRAEACLQDEHYLLSESQRIASIGSWKVDLSNGVVSWSDETFRIYGHDKTFAPTVGNLLQLLHPDDSHRRPPFPGRTRYAGAPMGGAYRETIRPPADTVQ